MILRRKRFKTAFLQSLVHPIPLLEALRALQERGDIEWYEYGKYRCIIKLTRASGLAMMIKEASEPVANARPYVHNKSTKNEKFRKIKG